VTSSFELEPLPVYPFTLNDIIEPYSHQSKAELSSLLHHQKFFCRLLGCGRKLALIKAELIIPSWHGQTTLAAAAPYH